MLRRANSWQAAVIRRLKRKEDAVAMRTAARVPTAADARIVPAAGAAGYALRIRRL